MACRESPGLPDTPEGPAACEVEGAAADRGLNWKLGRGWLEEGSPPCRPLVACHNGKEQLQQSCPHCPAAEAIELFVFLHALRAPAVAPDRGNSTRCDMRWDPPSLGERVSSIHAFIRAILDWHRPIPNLQVRAHETNIRAKEF